MAGWLEVQERTCGWRLASVLDGDSFVGQSPSLWHPMLFLGSVSMS